MMKKEELLRFLKEALNTEEKGIFIYTRHLEPAIFWTGLKEDKVQKAKELLRRLAVGSASHKKVVEDLIKKVEEEDKDAF